MDKKKTTARSLALDSLIALERDGRYSNLEVNTVLERSGLEGADRGLYTRLVYGVTERRYTLDCAISQYSRLRADGLDDDVRTALRLGIYQLLFMDRIPEHSAVDETVALVGRQKSGYVNAVLRSFLRGEKKFGYPKDRDGYLEAKYSVPRELICIYRTSVCEDELEDFLAALNREPKVGIRVNTLKTDVEAVRAALGGEVSALASDVVLADGVDDKVRDGIEKGLWFVEDSASRAAAAAVGARAGETVVDVCACPGGKSFSMAMDMGNEGVLYSFDLHKNKLSLIENGAKRLGTDIIRTAARDARNPDETLIGKADRVLCDAPCSGLGVIAKKPDIRYKNTESISGLPEVQYGILCGASEYVKQGGTLVYSTCTVNRAENEAVAERFLKEHPSFSLEYNQVIGGGMKTFMPHRDGCDGFFAAHMIRKR